jgi:Pyridoxamine 5'-phosphate oxidase
MLRHAVRSVPTPTCSAPSCTCRVWRCSAAVWSPPGSHRALRSRLNAQVWRKWSGSSANRPRLLHSNFFHSPNCRICMLRTVAAGGGHITSTVPEVYTENVDPELKAFQEHQKTAARPTHAEHARTLMALAGCACQLRQWRRSGGRMPNTTSHDCFACAPPLRPHCSACALPLAPRSTGVLSSVSSQPAHKGFPAGSVVEFALDAQGRPLLATSTLSPHTADLQGDGRCSITVTAPGFTVRRWLVCPPPLPFPFLALLPRPARCTCSTQPARYTCSTQPARCTCSTQPARCTCSTQPARCTCSTLPHDEG